MDEAPSLRVDDAPEMEEAFTNYSMPVHRDREAKGLRLGIMDVPAREGLA
jgi:hypothetical protein